MAAPPGAHPEADPCRRTTRRSRGGSAAEDAPEAALDGGVERRSESAVIAQEAPAALRQAQAGPGAVAGVLQESEAGGALELAQETPGIPVRHPHSRRSRTERAESIHALQQLFFSVTKERARPQRQPELGAHAEPSGPALAAGRPAPSGGSAFLLSSAFSHALDGTKLS